MVHNFIKCIFLGWGHREECSLFLSFFFQSLPPLSTINKVLQLESLGPSVPVHQSIGFVPLKMEGHQKQATLCLKY